MIYITYYDSPVGQILLASKDHFLIGLWIEGQKNYLENLDCQMMINDDDEILQEAKIWLDQYFGGKNPSINQLKLAPIGNSFRQEVWKILCEIPYGEVTTYKEVAVKVAKKMKKANKITMIKCSLVRIATKNY